MGLPFIHHTKVVTVAEHLQVQQPYLVPSLPRRFRHQLQSQRLQAQINLRVHQRAGMDEESFHFALLQRLSANARPCAQTSLGQNGGLMDQSLDAGSPQIACIVLFSPTEKVNPASPLKDPPLTRQPASI